MDPKRYSVDEALDIIFADNNSEGEGAEVSTDGNDDRDHETEAVAETDDSSTSLYFPLGQVDDDASLPQDARENSNRMIGLLNFAPVGSRGPLTRGGRRGPRTRGGTRGRE